MGKKMVQESEVPPTCNDCKEVEGKSRKIAIVSDGFRKSLHPTRRTQNVGCGVRCVGRYTCMPGSGAMCGNVGV